MIFDFRLLRKIEQGTDGSLGLGVGGGDDHAFAGGEAIGFHDDGSGAGAEIGDGAVGVVEKGRGGGWDRVLQQDVLGEDLRGLKPGAIGLGAVGGNAGFDQLVHQAERQRHLGADDDEFNFLFLREGDEAGDVVHGHRKARHVLRNAGVAWRADHARLTRGGEQQADQRMLASTGADDED